MPDDKSKPGGQDRTRIDVNEPYELRDWAHKFGVLPAQLIAAVNQVGDQVSVVEQHLKGGGRHA